MIEFEWWAYVRLQTQCVTNLTQPVIDLALWVVTSTWATGSSTCTTIYRVGQKAWFFSLQ